MAVVDGALAWQRLAMGRPSNALQSRTVEPSEAVSRGRSIGTEASDVYRAIVCDD
jgi:hypothetical protein